MISAGPVAFENPFRSVESDHVGAGRGICRHVPEIDRAKRPQQRFPLAIRQLSFVVRTDGARFVPAGASQFRNVKRGAIVGTGDSYGNRMLKAGQPQKAIDFVLSAQAAGKRGLVHRVQVPRIPMLLELIQIGALRIEFAPREEVVGG